MSKLKDMTREEIENFDKVATQLQSFYDETAVLVKKDPSAAMNKFKIGLINKVLNKANDILDERKPFDNFTEFDPDDLNNNSDVEMILGQYICCLEEIRKDNIHMHAGYWYWNIDGKEEGDGLRTYLPDKYKFKR